MNTKAQLLRQLRKSSADRARVWNRGARLTEKLQSMRYSGTEKSKAILAAKIDALLDEYQRLGVADRKIFEAYQAASGLNVGVMRA